MQALRAAARDGVDVRLLVPGASDIPALSPLSRAGYRPLLEAGVRVFEWNGTMLHAKTAVADGLWARVGSTNLNLASWMRQLRARRRDRGRRRSPQQMAAQYEADLGARDRDRAHAAQSRARATERAARHRRRARARVGQRRARGRGRASASAARWARRSPIAALLGPAEAGLLVKVAWSRSRFAVVAALWPRVLAWPLAVLAAWLGVAWLGKAWALRRRPRGPPARAAAASRRAPATVASDGA